MAYARITTDPIGAGAPGGVPGTYNAGWSKRPPSIVHGLLESFRLHYTDSVHSTQQRSATVFVLLHIACST